VRIHKLSLNNFHSRYNLANFYKPNTNQNCMHVVYYITICSLRTQLNSNFIYFTTISEHVIHTTFIYHGRWPWWLRSCSLHVRGNRRTKRQPTCPTWWPHDHLTSDARYRNRVAAVRGDKTLHQSESQQNVGKHRWSCTKPLKE